MVKKIRLLGMEMDHFSLREELLLGEGFYNKNEVSIIRTVSMKMLGMAVDNSTVREQIIQADLLIIDEKEILQEAGIHSAQRLREAAEHGFMKEYLRRMNRNQRQIFLTAQNQEQLELLKVFLETAYERMQIVGSYILDDCNGEYDNMVNEINAAAPDVVLSVIPSPAEEEFLLKARAKIGAKVWYSMGEYYQVPSGRISFWQKLVQLVHKGKFKSAVHKFEGEE